MRPTAGLEAVRTQATEMHHALARLLRALERGEATEIRDAAWAAEAEAEGILETTRTLQRPRR